METILDKIIAVKKQEVQELRQYLFTANPVYERRSFISQLEKSSEISIIAEFKRASPSKGDINPNVDPKAQASLYTGAGADAVSVLTDKTFFKGSLTDLSEVRSTIDKPVLCKDFIIDSLQIDAAKEAGADIILLIAAALTDEDINRLYQYALQKDLEVLMEVHNEQEAERVLKTDNLLIGVNNRNLKTFEVDIEVTERLAPMIKKAGRFLISESGMKTLHDVERVAKAGANGILVGETFMKHENPTDVIKKMKLPLVEVNAR